MARADRIRAAGMIAGADRALITMSDLFAVAAEAMSAKDRPAPASHRLVRHAALYELLSDPEVDLCAPLRSCRERSADRDALLSWIDRISARADQEHAAAATTPVERGIELLRRALSERELHSETQRRAIIARGAEHVRLGYGLVVAPQYLDEPFVSGLLKGLSVRQPVTVEGLTNAHLTDAWLAHARMERTRGAPTPTLTWQRDDAPGALFGPGRAPGGMFWCETSNQYAEALAHIGALLGDGTDPAQITLALSHPERELIGFEQYATRAGVPICARLPVGWKHTAIGRFAYAAAGVDADPEKLRISGAHLGLTIGDVEGAVALRGIERAAHLRELLEARALRPGVPDEVLARELAWLDALQAEIDASAALGQVRARTIIEGATSGSLMLGDPGGVAVVGYAEAQSLRRMHLVATGLNDGEWPPRTHPSPFISAETLARCPGLADPDRRVDFTAACVAHEQIMLLCEGLDGAGRRRARSVLFAAAVDAGAEELTPVAHTSSDTATRPVVSPTPTPPLTRRAKQTRFSVSELTQYLECPRGWAVRYGLGVRSERTDAQEIGEINHAMLEAAFTPADASPQERVELARDAARKAGLDDIGVETNLMHVQRVIETYSPPVWPGTPTLLEHRCELTGPSGEVTIIGRVDRIDTLPDGSLLLIDYKRGGRSYPIPEEALKRNMQATAYPAMVAEQLKKDVVGILFVSITSAAHNGLLRRRIDRIDPTFVRFHPKLYHQGARRNAAEATRGIRDYRVYERGPGCWDRCPCHGLRDLVGP